MGKGSRYTAAILGTASILALVLTGLASTYLSLRHQDGQSLGGPFSPTWQTIASEASISLLLLLYILSIIFRARLYNPNHEQHNPRLFFIRTGVMILLGAFYGYVTIQNIAFEITMVHLEGKIKPRARCTFPSVRCDVGRAQMYITFVFLPFLLLDAFFRALFWCRGRSRQAGDGNDGNGGK
ncbi:MAG: hypothetical protein J3R72DRAFT_454284 [Linnemannia gamsii]|nr:MAG: hypothetical protein J3R72DRAFT_454284 [Linnemannia gamsii]